MSIVSICACASLLATALAAPQMSAPISAPVDYASPANVSGSGQSGASVQFTSNFGRCNDTGPFVMDYSQYWRCTSDAMDCYNTVIQKLMHKVHSSSCAANGTCIYHSTTHYASGLRRIMLESVQRQAQSPSTPGAPCSWGRWTAEMDYVANIVLQRASRCQVDYAAIFELYDVTQQLFNLEEKCLQAGMTLPGASNSTTTSASPATQALTPPPIQPQPSLPAQPTITSASSPPAVRLPPHAPSLWVRTPRAGQ